MRLSKINSNFSGESKEVFLRINPQPQIYMIDLQYKCNTKKE